jgi:hypothetical protein
MLISLAGSATTFLGFALVENLWGYLAVSGAAGLIGSSSFDAARNAMVADFTPEHMRAQAYGLVRVGGYLGWSLGPLAAGLIATSAGSSGITYRAMIAGTAALTIAVLIPLALLVREALPETKRSEPLPPSTSRSSGPHSRISRS